MQNSQVVRAELKRIGEKISEISGVQGAVYAGHHTVASASSNGAVASGGVKMGFVDTDARSEVGVMPDVQPVSNIYDDVSLDFEGYSLGQLQRRRQEYKRIGGDNPTCPACNMTFPRRTWQDVFCKAEHRAEFNNQIRRLTRSGS